MQKKRGEISQTSRGGKIEEKEGNGKKCTTRIDKGKEEKRSRRRRQELTRRMRIRPDKLARRVRLRR